MTFGVAQIPALERWKHCTFLSEDPAPAEWGDPRDGGPTVRARVRARTHRCFLQPRWLHADTYTHVSRVASRRGVDKTSQTFSCKAGQRRCPPPPRLPPRSACARPSLEPALRWSARPPLLCRTRSSHGWAGAEQVSARRAATAPAPQPRPEALAAGGAELPAPAPAPSPRRARFPAVARLRARAEARRARRAVRELRAALARGRAARTALGALARAALRSGRAAGAAEGMDGLARARAAAELAAVHRRKRLALATLGGWRWVLHRL
jgi:hypothetical protein